MFIRVGHFVKSQNVIHQNYSSLKEVKIISNYNIPVALSQTAKTAVFAI